MEGCSTASGVHDHTTTLRSHHLVINYKGVPDFPADCASRSAMLGELQEHLNNLRKAVDGSEHSPDRACTSGCTGPSGCQARPAHARLNAEHNEVRTYVRWDDGGKLVVKVDWYLAEIVGPRGRSRRTRMNGTVLQLKDALGGLVITWDPYDGQFQGNAI